MAINDESILTSVKKLLGITEDYTVFDTDVLIHINSAFATLHQIGIGPNEGFYVEDKGVKWSDVIGIEKILSSVKTYVYIKVKLVFDPPATSYLISSLANQAKELEWRMNAAIDPYPVLNEK